MGDSVSRGAPTGGLARAGEEPARGATGPEELEPSPPPSRYAKDTINFVDLWLVLIRRRFILVATVLACILAGILFAFLRPPSYAFTTTIQIGRLGLDETFKSTSLIDRSLEPPETVVAKLNQGYIPKVLAEYVAETDGRTALTIEASNPKRSQIVLLKSKAPEKESELHVTLHNKIGELLLVDHAGLIGNFERFVKLEITQERSKYESLLDETRALANYLELLDGTKALLEKQISEIQDLLPSTASALERALSEVSDEAKALTFLMVGNEIQQNRTRLATLEERLHVLLPQERSQLEKKIADLKRDTITQQEKISTIEARLSSVRETRLLVGPARSIEPVGPDRAVILALAGVLGLILGVLAAFFAEFLAKVRAARANEEVTAAREPAVGGR